MKTYFASGNDHKKQELEAILGIKLTIPKDEQIDFDPDENGKTFFENAYIKACALWNLVHAPVIADDSGICVNALNGAPGIHSARYGADSANGKKLTSTEQNALLLATVGDNTNRACQFVCCMILMITPDIFYTAQETFEGQLTREPCGIGGFGYDPIVFIPELKKTVAELTAEEKNNYSHRAKAGKAIKNFLINEKK